MDIKSKGEELNPKIAFETIKRLFLVTSTEGEV